MIMISLCSGIIILKINFILMILFIFASVFITLITNLSQIIIGWFLKVLILVYSYQLPCFNAHTDCISSS